MLGVLLHAFPLVSVFITWQIEEGCCYIIVVMIRVAPIYKSDDIPIYFSIYCQIQIQIQIFYIFLPESLIRL